MRTVTCPYCHYKFPFEDNWKKGDPIVCTNCNSYHNLYETKHVFKQDFEKSSPVSRHIVNPYKATNKNIEQPNTERVEMKSPIKKQKKEGVSIFAVLALVLLVILLFNGFISWYNTTYSTPSNNSSYRVEKQNDILGNNSNYRVEIQNDIPDNDEAFTISKNFVDDYITDASYDFIPNPNVIRTGNTYTVVCRFSVNHIRYNYECTMAFMGGKWSEKRNWKLLFFYIDGKEFYYDENYKKYIQR